MQDELNINLVEWLPPGMGGPAERMTTAEVSITVGNRCVTEVEDFESRSVRRSIRVSAEPLAKWLLTNWWRLRYEPQSVEHGRRFDWAMAHCTASVGGGYVWPDFIFQGSDGALIFAECRSQDLIRDASFIRYLRSFSAAFTVDSFERTAMEFVQTVLARLEAIGVRSSELLTLWKEVQRERENPKYALVRRFEALLGLDPDENPGLIDELRKRSKVFGVDALEEIFAASTPESIKADLDEVKLLSATIGTFADLSTVPRTNSGTSGENPPWLKGQEAAYAVRQSWGLAFKPIRLEQIADALQINAGHLNNVKPSAPFSFGLAKGTEKVGFLLNRDHPQGRRFDIARLIGDWIYMEGDQLLPATTSTTVRQKFQRAFAAELLCPSQMIEERFHDGLDRKALRKAVEDLAWDYDVSEQLILHHMQNRGILVGEDHLMFA